jgi:hypothetical protein
MGKHDQSGDKRISDVVLGRALLLLFGLAVLGFLVAVDPAERFSMRAATGASLAMAKVSYAGILGKEDASSTSIP